MSETVQVGLNMSVIVPMLVRGCICGNVSLPEVVVTERIGCIFYKEVKACQILYLCLSEIVLAVACHYQRLYERDGIFVLYRRS